MKILFVVQPLTGDPIDDNHVRVEHHHAEGLTYTDCLIDGVERYVRSTSRMDKRHPVTKTRTILVHLRALPNESWRPQCRDLDALLILKKVQRDNTWPSRTEYLHWNPMRGVVRFGNIFKRKQQSLVRKGYVRLDNGVPFITDKGLTLLEG